MNLHEYLTSNPEVHLIIRAGNQEIDTGDILCGLLVDVLRSNRILSVEEAGGITYVTVDPESRL